ncbi:MAG: alpha/beta fold hydrolase, partial [Candidatus Rokuibacteriota bacterium]
MQTVKTNGITVATTVWPGRGPTVVAVHGLTANHTCWYPIAAGLAPAVRFVAYDLRGRGDSEKPATGYSLEHHTRDLLGLLDHFAVERGVIIGHSLGAHIALRVAAHHPDRVARLVLVDGGLDVRAEVFDSLAPAIERLGLEFPSREAFLERMRALPMFAGRWNAALERYFSYDVEPAPGGGVRSKAPRAAVAEELANLQRERLWVWHHKVAAPTLLLRAPDGLLRDT